MAINTLSIAKSGLKSAIIEALYNEILTNSNNYYYFLGRTLAWNEEDVLEDPQIDLAYEADVRAEMILLKKITSADVSYIIPRHNWNSGTVFDMYDDQIGRTQAVSSASWTSGKVTINAPDHGFVEGDIVKITGITPDSYNGKYVVTFAQSNRFEYDAEFTDNVYASGGLITRCSTLGNETLEDSKFYCMTSDYHVYKCLDNNGGAPSTVKPYSTSPGRLILSDGYIWKYMYTVPIASRNKFMTLFDIPVTTAIKAPYYSRGSINSVTVNAYGLDYTPGSTTLRVYGNGYLEENPLRILGLNITEPGEGYITDPIAYSDDPFASEAFAIETEVLQGVYLKAGKHIYKTISAGTTGLSAPTHTSGEIIYNGTVALQYVGTTLTIELTRTGDAITDATLLGMLGYINVTNPGFGYTTAPNISITGNGTNAEASCNVSEGRISNITIENRGEDYTLMQVTFDPPMVEDATWTSEATVSLNEILEYDGNFYEVTNVDAGTTLGITPPVHNSGTVTNGDVELTFVAATATGTADIFYGYGYSQTPEIYVSSAPIGGITTELSAATIKTDALLAPVIVNGQIVSAIVINGGVGYTSATIEAIGAGEGALLSPNLSYGDLNTNQANIELLAVPGTIDAIKITNPGTGYFASNAVVTITGDGEGAEATATVIGGKLSSITVTNTGSGYTHAMVTISAPDAEDGVQAKARAIVSPVDGHGKNAVEELGASDISLFSSIAAELNQGFTVTNDYRQLGILKNPQQFATNKRLNTVLGSACYAVNVSYPGSDGSNIPLDTDLLDENNNRFRVVAIVTGSNSCSLLLQSVDNAELQLAQNLYFIINEEISGTLSINNLVAPTANKYTGSMLFIDNRNAFVPNIEQTLAMKTAIRF